MEALLLLAMVVSAGITHAIHNGKNRSKAAYDEYRQRVRDRAAAREKAREEAAQAWEQRLQAARSTGPSAPLWWAYTAGMVTAGTAAALVAGATGALTGLAQGAAGGWTVGREGGQKGWTFAARWAEWRRRNPRTPIEMRQCARCKGYTSEPLTNTAEYGLVCADCVPAPTPERPATPADEEPEEPEDIVHERRPEDDYVPPPRCANRCGMDAATGSDLCTLCQILRLNQWEREAEQRRKNTGPRAERETFSHRCSCGAPAVPGAERCTDCLDRLRKQQETQKQRAQDEKPETIRVPSERVYPDQEDDTQPKEIENMNALPAGQPYTSVDTGDDNVDLVKIKNTLSGLAQQAARLSGQLTEFQELLTTKHFHANDLSAIADAIESFDQAKTKLLAAKERVQRHDDVAEAAASSLGGADHMADRSVYGEY